jgi:hypothetical protein
MSAAELDGKPLVSLGGDASLHSEGFSARAPHFDIDVKGAASHVIVGIG